MKSGIKGEKEASGEVQKEEEKASAASVPAIGADVDDELNEAPVEQQEGDGKPVEEEKKVPETKLDK